MKERFDVVVPTIGRPSLEHMIAALAAGTGPRPGRVLVVDDRKVTTAPLPVSGFAGVTVLRGRAAGPAAARNVGWRASAAEWIAFLDDDVVPCPDWRTQLAFDLDEADALPAVGSQGRVVVPLPAGRAPTDRERSVQGLEAARWATADMAYRRSALEEVGGFDERFRRAYREDADLALRVSRRGHALARGHRTVTHPARPESWWVSVHAQRGNADDALMRALHGRRWRDEIGAPPGRRPRHLAITAAAITSALAAIAGHRRTAAIFGIAWLAGTLELAWARIAKGPRTRDEIATMLATSALIPAAATYHFLRGWADVPRLLARRPRPRAVLLDRDGTLVHDVPYNRDPGRVTPVSGARDALDRLRAEGIALAVVTNQSGVARGLVTEEEVRAVNARVEELVGPIAQWIVCPHAEADACGCRKPLPGMVLRAAAALGVAPSECALIGDTGADVRAALSAGARAVLVPNGVTREDEIAAAPEVARDLASAIELLLGGPP